MEKHVIFDLDGTLIDSKNEIIDTYTKVISIFPPASEINLKAVNFGATLQYVLECIYGTNIDLISKAKKLFSEIYDGSSYEKTLLYSNAKEVLRYLVNNKYNLYIATNKRMHPAVQILKKKNIFLFFKDIKASDMNGGKLMSKQAMVESICNENSIHSGYMIGDSIQDVEAGQALRLQTVAATYGYEKKDELIKKNPTFVISGLSDLYNIIM